MDSADEQIPEDDWVDQDILTKNLAAELLDVEIAAEEDKLRRIESGDALGSGGANAAEVQRRIEAMRVLRRRLTLPSRAVAEDPS